MSLQARGTMTPDREISNIIVSEGVAAEVAANEISIYALDTVPLHRQLEIFNAWIWLWNGIRDRALLDGPFTGNILYSGSSILQLTEPDRRTSSVIASFNDDDVVVGLGSGVTTQILSAVTPLETGFLRLRNAALEQFLKAA